MLLFMCPFKSLHIYSGPELTQKGLERLDKNLKTIQKTYVQCVKTQHIISLGKVVIESFYRVKIESNRGIDLFFGTNRLTNFQHYSLRLLIAGCTEWKHQSGSPAINIHAFRKCLKEPKLTFNLIYIILPVLGIGIRWIRFIMHVYKLKVCVFLLSLFSLFVVQKKKKKDCDDFLRCTWIEIFSITSLF